MHHTSYVYTQTITHTVSTYCVQELQPRSGTYLFDPASILRDNTPLGILKSMCISYLAMAKSSYPK